MGTVTKAQMAVIKRAKLKANVINFKVHDKTLVSMLRNELIELYTQQTPYFMQYYRLTDKAVNA